MRERTFLTAMVGLDVLLILAGGVMGWQHAVPRLPGLKTGSGPVEAVVSMMLISIIGAWALYEVNFYVFRLAESPSTRRTASMVAGTFVAATLAGGVIGMMLA